MELIQENPNRFVLFPIKYPTLYEFYKKHEACFWTAEEIDLSDDIDHWDKLHDREREFILKILGFFAASDGIVIENLVKNFCSEVQLPEARAFYGFQTAMENIHSETYSILIQKFARTIDKQDKLFHSVQNHDATKAKADWALKYITPTECPTMDEKLTDFSKRLIAFACVEGIAFSSSFCALFWLKSRGLCPGLTFSNELISRDEGLHRDFAVEIYKMCPKLPVNDVLDIVKSCVEVELNFVRDVLPEKLKGMNKTDMQEYVKYVADHLLNSLGYKEYYNAKQPFNFMEIGSLNGKTNFFERRVGEYSKANVGTDAPATFDLESDF